MSKLLINENPLIVLPSLATAIGLERAIIVQQVHFLLNQPKSGKILEDGFKYIWNSYEDWQKEHFPFIKTPDAVRKHFLKLEQMGILKSAKPNAFKYDHTKYYRIDYERFDEVAESNRTASPHHDTDCESDSERTASPILNKDSETTTETTTESYSPPDGNLSLVPASVEETAGRQTRAVLKRDELFETLANVCRIDWKLCTDKQRGALNQTCGILRKNGKTVTELQRVGEYWYGQDWRGQKGQPPTPELIREVWQAALTQKEGQNGNTGRRQTEAEKLAATSRYQQERRNRERDNGDTVVLPYADARA